MACNIQLAAAYQIKEELRGVLAASDDSAMAEGMDRILRRTQRKANVQMRKLNESLRDHLKEILALGKHRSPVAPVGRIEALNNNWETLVRTRLHFNPGTWRRAHFTDSLITARLAIARQIDLWLPSLPVLPSRQH